MSGRVSVRTIGHSIRPSRLPSVQRARAFGERFANPRLRAIGGLVEIIGPTSQSRSSGLPTFSARVAATKRSRNVVGDRLVDVEPLQADADLAGVGERGHHRRGTA